MEPTFYRHFRHGRWARRDCMMPALSSFAHRVRSGLACLLVAGLAACSAGPGGPPPEPSGLVRQSFGTTPDGRGVDLYTLTNRHDVEVLISTLGAAIVSIRTPDRDGAFDDIVLGFDDLTGYLANDPYFGVVVGRYGNRIAGGRFSLAGTEYQLTVNDGPNHLHGGLQGFDRVVWDATPLDRPEGPALALRYVSPAGEEGYPGTLDATVVYVLTGDSELRLEYTATTDAPTIVNLTSHAYFNLRGEGDVLGHEILIAADRFTPVGPGLIPTGALRAVEGTPFDFMTPTAIGAGIAGDDEQLRLGGGYDHNFVLRKPPGEFGLAARVHDPASGRVLEVRTTEPGVQFYTGNFLDGSIAGKDGRAYQVHSGFCLETQHYPDSPNQSSFPSTVLEPGARYESTTVLTFATE